MQEPEHILIGGNVATNVVRVGSTVWKPVTIATPAVKSLLDFLHDAGYPASPQHLGIDEHGRQILQFIPGVVSSSGPLLSLRELEDVGKLIRHFHELSARFHAAPEARWDVAMTPDRQAIICHNDLAPWNLIRNGDRFVFIDWDASGPGSQLWDLSYAALTFTPVVLHGLIGEMVPRIGALIRGYDLSSIQGLALPAMMRRRALEMKDLLVNGAANGTQPWARFHAEGHASYWEGAANFVFEHHSELELVCAQSTRQ